MTLFICAVKQMILMVYDDVNVEIDNDNDGDDDAVDENFDGFFVKILSLR